MENKASIKSSELLYRGFVHNPYRHPHSVGLHVLRSAGPDILPKPLGFCIKSWDCILQPCHDMQKKPSAISAEKNEQY